MPCATRFIMPAKCSGWRKVRSCTSIVQPRRAGVQRHHRPLHLRPLSRGGESGRRCRACPGHASLTLRVRLPRLIGLSSSFLASNFIDRSCTDRHEASGVGRPTLLRGRCLNGWFRTVAKNTPLLFYSFIIFPLDLLLVAKNNLKIYSQPLHDVSRPYEPTNHSAACCAPARVRQSWPSGPTRA